MFSQRIASRRPTVPFNLRAFGIATVCALALAPRAHAKETAAQIAGRKAVLANYVTYARAMKTRDSKSLMSLLAPDYVHHTVSGNIIDRASEENSFRRMFSLPIRVTTYRVKVQKWQWNGPDVAVWLQIDMTMSPVSGKSKPIIGHITERDYWSPMQGGWKLRQAVDISATNPFG